MYPNNSLLLLKCSDDIASNEIDAIKNLAELHSVQVLCVDKTIGETIQEKAAGTCFSLVYLSGHGSLSHFGGQSGACATWETVAIELCEAACLQDGASIFCACCRGGLANVALTFFEYCPSVEYVCGPRASTLPNTISLGFHVLMHNLLFRCCDADEACRLASLSTGHSFLIHDRQEFESKKLIAAKSIPYSNNVGHLLT